MAKEGKHRHTLRYFVYRVGGLLALLASVGVLLALGVSVPSAVVSLISAAVGALLLLSARGAERLERRTHFVYSNFLGHPRLMLFKAAVAACAVLLAFAVLKYLGTELPEQALDEDVAEAIEENLGSALKWWAVVPIVALAVLGQALSDWWETRHNIHVAVANGRLAAVEKLIVSKPDVVNSVGAYGRTPLHLAAAIGQTPIAKVLIFEGADVNAKADGGWTALHWAAMSGREDLVRRLVEEGADVNARAEDGTTPLVWAMRNRHDEVSAVLRWHGAEE